MVEQMSYTHLVPGSSPGSSTDYFSYSLLTFLLLYPHPYLKQ